MTGWHANKVSWGPSTQHSSSPARGISCGLTRIIHECRSEPFETEVSRGFSHVRPTKAYLQSVEEAEREKPRRARGSDDGAGIHE